MWHKTLGTLLVLLSIGGLAAAAPDLQADIAGPDLILLNGRVYTSEQKAPWAEAFAVTDGVITRVGRSEEIAQLKTERTQVVDARGRMVMPGINDGHSHPVWGSLKQLYQCNFPFSSSPKQVLEAIKECVEKNPQAEWIQGGQWTSNFFVDNKIPSPAKFLDQVSDGKAVLLRDDSGHNLWVNSKALALMGLNSSSPDPRGGSYSRDPETGELTGLLLEAFTAAKKVVPPYTAEQYREGARFAVNSANSFGITGVKDASAEEPEVAGFHALDQAGELSLRVTASLIKSSDDSDFDLDIEWLQRIRDKYRTPLINTSATKIFLDGVPTASRTAAMLEPYLPEQEGGELVSGSLHVETGPLRDAVTQLDALGFTVKIHAAGDRSVRVALDAIEAARKANGNSGLRHELSHTEFISPEDIPRFAELNAVAGFTPYIWWPSPITDSIVDAVGKERVARIWPARELLAVGAPMLAGSDWPSAVPDMNPWPSMEALITRRDPFGNHPGVLAADQALTLEEVLKLYTLDGARALAAEDVTGSIASGKSADFIILDRNLFDSPAEEIGETRVLSTYFAGRKVYPLPAP